MVLGASFAPARESARCACRGSVGFGHACQAEVWSLGVEVLFGIVCSGALKPRGATVFVSLVSLLSEWRPGDVSTTLRASMLPQTVSIITKSV